MSISYGCVNDKIEYLIFYGPVFIYDRICTKCVITAKIIFFYTQNKLRIHHVDVITERKGKKHL